MTVGRAERKVCNSCGIEKLYEEFKISRTVKGVKYRAQPCYVCHNQKTIAKRYGIPFEEYEERMRLQNGICAICKKIEIDDFVLDHDHNTGELRMFLCGKCNKGLGHFSDDPNLFRIAANYLEEF